MGKALTTTEAAARKGVSVHTIHKWIWQGRLTARRFGRLVQIDRDELDRLERRPAGRPRTRPR